MTSVQSPITAQTPWPTDITYKKSLKTLFVMFNTGEKIGLTAELLRCESPSAEVQGHSPSQKITVTGKENVAITAIEPVGNYAVRLVFDDGHQTGLYSWNFLYELAHRNAPAPSSSAQSCGCGNKKGCSAA
ncbi:MAG: DUF971 domain-containing protein [Pseudobdellovibrionaceae bacterium]